MKINTVETVIQDFREGQNIFRRPSVELLVREISRLNKHIAELDNLKAEIERLRKVSEYDQLKSENDKLRAENERLWKGFGLLKNWTEAYPLEVFPEQDLKLARKLLEDGGVNYSALNVYAMRHVINGVKRIIKEVKE